MRSPRLVFSVLLALVCAGAIAAGPAAAAPKVVWLCKPGMKDNPCEPSLKTTRLSTTGQTLGVDNVKRAKHPKFDCFYVYPTVSDQKTPVANLNIDPELRSIALYQAARYSSVCRVYAPVYRQGTLAALNGAVTQTPEQRKLGPQDVTTAWRTYLKKYNKGRGVVIMGHSQGSFVLRNVMAKEVDAKPKVRKKLISAVLLGGNVEVKKGKDVGGDFKHIKSCKSRTQVGCVIAFSTFNATPPADAIFGQTQNAANEVLCSNPAALGGGSGKLTPIYPTEPFAPGTTIGIATLAVGNPLPDVGTAWISVPGSYSATCSSTGGINVLLVSPLNGAPMLSAIPTPEWGLHLVDANIALGNLTKLVATEAAAWSKKQHPHHRRHHKHR